MVQLPAITYCIGEDTLRMQSFKLHCIALNTSGRFVVHSQACSLHFALCCNLWQPRMYLPCVGAFTFTSSSQHDLELGCSSHSRTNIRACQAPSPANLEVAAKLPLCKSNPCMGNAAQASGKSLLATMQADALEPEQWREQLQGAVGVVSCLGAFGSNEFMLKVHMCPISRGQGHRSLTVSL